GRKRACATLPRTPRGRPRVLASVDDASHLPLGERRVPLLVAPPSRAYLLGLPAPAEPLVRPLQRPQGRSGGYDASHRTFPRDPSPGGEVGDARRRRDVRIDAA